MAISKTKSDIRPLPGANIRRFDCGSAVDAGAAVYIAADGDVEEASADAETSARARGIAVANRDGGTAFASGDRVDVVLHGPVTGYSSMDEGKPIYADGDSGTGAGPGSMVQTAPTTAVTGGASAYQFIVGYAESTTTIYVQPQAAEPTATGS